MERHLEVTRTARYWTLGDPASHRGDPASHRGDLASHRGDLASHRGDLASARGDVWFVLHGYKQLARRFLRRFESIDDGARLIVAPEALSRFYVGAESGRHGAASVVGATWMTREDRENEIRDYVAYLDKLAGVLLRGGERVTVLGFSQGVATAIRWMTLGEVRPDRLVLWGDLIPPDLDLSRAATALAGTEVTLVRGDDDGSLDPDLVADEAKRLAAAAIPHRILTYEGGHDVDPETLARIAGL